MTRLTPVGEMAELHRRWIDPSPTTEYVQIGIHGFGRGIFHYPAVAGVELGRLRFARVEPGDLVVSNIKAWEGAIDVAGESEVGCIASNRFLTYRLAPDRADAGFLRYFLLSNPGLRLIGKASPGSADRNRTLAIDRFEALEIPLPPIDEQRRIAAHLESVFSRVELADSLAHRATAVAEALRWAATRADFSEPDMPLEDAASINPEAVNPDRDIDAETFQYIDIGSVANGTGLIADPKTVHVGDAPSRARKRVAAGDVLVATVRPNLKGVALVLDGMDGAVCSTGFAVLRPKAGVVPEYLFLQCLSDAVTEQLVESTRGGHYPAVPDRKLREVRITLPGVPEQREVAERVGRLFRDLSENRTLIAKRNRLLQALPKSLLNDCFDSRH